MNKKNSYLMILLLCISACILPGCSTKGETDTPSLAVVEQGFRNIPDSIRIGCYWYWLSDNISKEGVVKDLQAMKRAGITRAYIGNIGKEVPIYGDVKIFTPEWWDAVHTALKTATELGIEIGMFNSPGWSQSGGPWIKPEQSMRYLAATDTPVSGPQAYTYTVPAYSDSMQLVKVIAYPAPDVVPFSESRQMTIDRGPAQLDMHLGDIPQTVQSLTFATRDYLMARAELQAKAADGTYRTLRTFEIDRTNYNNTVGFLREAPVALSLPPTKSTDFRLVIDTPQVIYGKVDATVTLSAARVVECWPEQSLAKMFQRPDPKWDSYMWSRHEWYTGIEGFAIPQDKVVDLTASLAKDGTLTWNVPEGNWVISCLEMKTTGVTNAPASPDATGLEVDKLSRKHAAAHFDAYMGEILRRIPAEDRQSLKVCVQDSYETGGQNWTDDMLERFKSTYGYDPMPWLPTLQGKVVGNEDLSTRFLWDLRRLIADGVSYEYVGGLTEICHRHGLTTWLENYGHWGFPGEFLQYGGQSDEIGGEFWSDGNLGDIENRAASSCAHIYGKRRVWSESCTSGGPNYHRYPAEMKARIDRFFTEGINSTLLHVNIHQPYEDRNPGMSAWFGNDFNRKNTWFSQMDLFTSYLRRANYVLQQGTYVADVAYFIGEDAPKMTGITDPALPRGYSYDYINAEVLLTRATVKEGYLTLPDGMRYRLLVLPNQNTMRPEVLKKIAELVSNGMAVYGSAPCTSPSLADYPEADKEVSSLGSELFANSTYGAGNVYSRGKDMQEVLDALGIAPDFSCAADLPVLYIHHMLTDGEIYFLSNQSGERVGFDAGFRVPDGYAPEQWNPVTAEIRRLPAYSRNAASTSLHIELDANESAFIVFRKGGHAADMAKENYAAPVVVKEITSPWTVSFEAGKRGPKDAVTFTQLTDWAQSDDDSIRYFSGTAVYQTTFHIDELPQAKEFYIDLGRVMVMAKVTLNGQPLGGVWTPPYQVNATHILQAGDNRLEVTVVNNWQNRLIGDQRLPEDQRQTWTVVNPWNAQSPLQSSGLLGPVSVKSIEIDK
jgi:hypothetical protein